MERSHNADVLSTFWFGLQTVLMLIVSVRRPGARGAFYDVGVGMIILYGFALPAILYLAYLVAVFLARWWRTRSFAEAWRSLFVTAWARRSTIAFATAFLANLGYMILLTFIS